MSATVALIELGEPGAASVLVGYVVTFGVIGTYAWRVLAKGRRLGRQVPDQDKPWT